MKVVEDLMKLLHPPEFMVWISCGLDEHESPQAFELLPRMGASPQTPWLRGAARHYAVHQVEPFIILMQPKW